MKADQPIVHPDARETIAYAELLKLAHEDGLKSIVTSLVVQPSEENGRLAIVKAAVETERGHYEGLGDADPGNVDDFLVPHLIRVAETRAKARALRDAVNIGVVSLEELDGVSPDRDSSPGLGAPPPRSPRHTRSAPPPARPRSSTPVRSPRANGNGSSEPMSEAQRRYLFRLMSGQGYYKDAAEERIKEIFEVSNLTEITKVAATKMIDELLQTSAPGNGGGGNGAPTRHQR
jgi:hypothetical protein